MISYVLLYRAADPVARLRQIPAVRGDDLRRLIEQQGLDAPWYEGYWTWLAGFVQRRLGGQHQQPGLERDRPDRATRCPRRSS